MCRAPAPTLAMGCASGSVSQPRRGGTRFTPRATFEETPAIPSAGALEAGNLQKLMPGFLGAQAKTGATRCFAPVSLLRDALVRDQLASVHGTKGAQTLRRPGRCALSRRGLQTLAFGSAAQPRDARQRRMRCRQLGCGSP